jgi:hypothetical protein
LYGTTTIDDIGCNFSFKEKYKHMRTFIFAFLITSLLLLTSTISFGELVPYRKGCYWGYSNFKKEIVIKPQYRDARPFINNRAAVCGFVGIEEGYYFIDHSGKKVSPIYDEVSDFEGNVARICRSGLWGLLSKNGREILKPQFLYIHSYHNGLALFVDSSNKYGVIDARGKIIVFATYDYFTHFNHGRAIAGTYINGQTKYQIINHKGKIMTPTSYFYLSGFNSRRCIIRKDSLYGFCSPSGKVKIPFQYSSAWGFSEGLAVVIKEDQKWVINKRGKCRFEIKHLLGYDPLYSSGMLIIRDDSLFGYIDRKNKVVGEIEYQACERFSSGLASIKKDGKWAFKNRNKFITDFIFDENLKDNFYTLNDIGYQFDKKLCRVIYKGKAGYINHKGVYFWED